MLPISEIIQAGFELQCIGPLNGYYDKAVMRGNKNIKIALFKYYLRIGVTVYFTKETSQGAQRLILDAQKNYYSSASLMDRTDYVLSALSKNPDGLFGVAKVAEFSEANPIGRIYNARKGKLTSSVTVVEFLHSLDDRVLENT